MARVVAGRRCDAGREFQIEGNGSTPEHLIYLEGYEDRVGGYRTRSYVDDYAHLTRYRYGQLELRFVLTDRLGSVVSVVRADRDSGGYVTALEPETGLAYDVFGAPRHATTWARLGVDEAWPHAHNPWDVTPTTRHGFTGHEMLSKQRLIHMRGRLFDPRMGRFTGVDPVIQFPLSTQGLNPYSYLLNNPLAGTDPTGYVADWESVQDRMWAMAGGYGANGSSTTAVLNGLRSAATGLGMSGAAGDAKAAGGSAPTSAAGGRADNGASTAQSTKVEAAATDRSGIESSSTRPNLSSDEKIADLHKETFATIGNTIAMAVGNWYPDSWNSILATVEVIGMQEPGSFGRVSEWVTARNEVAAERVGDVRAFIGTAVNLTGMRLGGFLGVGGRAGGANTAVGLADALLRPAGSLIGTVARGATPNIRTVSSKQFAMLQEQLLKGAKPAGQYAGGKGTWYELPSGGRVGVRTSDKSGVTLDINIPGLPSGLKVHQQ